MVHLLVVAVKRVLALFFLDSISIEPAANDTKAEFVDLVDDFGREIVCLELHAARVGDPRCRQFRGEKVIEGEER